ncbi:MAG: hypothetical protein M3Q30_13480, partial [Actinomycetota bacterium]|nr:hypothetical protein [Actinomycetota bacterium]
MPRRRTRAEVDQCVTVMPLTLEDETGGAPHRSLGDGVWVRLPRWAEYDDPASPVVASVIVGIPETKLGGSPTDELGFLNITLRPRSGVIHPADNAPLPLAYILDAVVRALPRYRGPVAPFGAFTSTAPFE